MTEAEFQRVLKEALEERYADIPDPAELAGCLSGPLLPQAAKI